MFRSYVALVYGDVEYVPFTGLGPVSLCKLVTPRATLSVAACREKADLYDLLRKTWFVPIERGYVAFVSDTFFTTTTFKDLVYGQSSSY